MDKEKIALYLNEHPEFFNDFPELLVSLKKIEEQDLPLQPLKTLSIADRILNRAQQDKEHMKNQLSWFMEVAETNEKILEHLFEIERICMYSHSFTQMVRELREEIIKRFDVPGVLVFLSDNESLFMDGKLENHVHDGDVEGLNFIDDFTLSAWFQQGWAPVLRGDLTDGSDIFKDLHSEAILSEALIPILLHGKLAGALCLGSYDASQFYPGLRTEFLERTAEKLGIAIENALLLEGMKNQSLLDPVTGLYNHTYFQPALRREFDRAKRYDKNLSCIKLHIDYWDDLMNTGDIDRYQVLVEVGNILKQKSRDGDILFRSDESQFLMLLPGIDGNDACEIGNRLKSDIEDHLNPGPEEAIMSITIRIVSFPKDKIKTCDEFDFRLSLSEEEAESEESESLSA